MFSECEEKESDKEKNKKDKKEKEKLQGGIEEGFKTGNKVLNDL